ncbi:hypothetical protein Q1695_007827 [Nippostrongylus brasiliensis]|nr:hypothetical protein Q1695_007827 [Nippostrongylus brasiliensis]
MAGKKTETSAESSLPQNRLTSAASLVLLRKADDLLTLHIRRKDESSKKDVVSQIISEQWIQCVFTVINDPKTSLADLRFLSKVFEKIVDVTVSESSTLFRDSVKAVLATGKSTFYNFLNELSTGEILYYGASLWLTYSKLLLCTFGGRMASKDWNDCFAPMEKWFKVSDGDSVTICLRVWTSFIGFAATKLTAGNLREKLLSTFSKPLRSHAVLNKISNATPIINAYTTLMSSYADSVASRFEELVICFLRFIVGRPVVIVNDPRMIADEISRPVNRNDFRLLLEGSSTDYLEYLVDPRPHRVFNDTLSHATSLLCSLLNPESSAKGRAHQDEILVQVRKFATFLTQVIRLAAANNGAFNSSSVCACFATLARSLEGIEDAELRHKELQFLFMQVQAWIIESTDVVKNLEFALCQLFQGGDLSKHANTIGQWPAKDLLVTLLKKSPAQISEFLTVVPETIASGAEMDNVVLKRVGEFCLLMEIHLKRFDSQKVLKTWSHVAEILTEYVRKTDDINEGNLLKPDFSTAFNVLKFVFEAGNYAEQDVEADIIKRCSAAFASLYEEVQSTVRHEVDCTAETVLLGVFGSITEPKTMCAVQLYNGALASVIGIYPLNLLSDKELFFGSYSDAKEAGGEVGTFVKLFHLVGKKVFEMMNSEQDEKVPRSLLNEFNCVVKACDTFFHAIERPALVRAAFVQLCDMLQDVYEKICALDTRVREITQEHFCGIIESVRGKISGPYDNDLLTECAPLLTKILNCRGKRTKIFTTTCSFWKDTFAKAQSLHYPPELRKVLIPLVKKRVLTAPGLTKSTNADGMIDSDNEDTSSVVSPSTASLSSSRPRRSRKLTGAQTEPSQQSCSSVSEKIEEKPIVVKGNEKLVGEGSAPPSAKVPKKETEELTKDESKPLLDSNAGDIKAMKTPKPEEKTPSRRGPTPRTKRKMCLGLLDEDSVDYVPIVSSESAKKMKLTDRQREIFSEKRERMPFLDEDSQTSAVISHIATEFDVESSQSILNVQQSQMSRKDPLHEEKKGIDQQNDQIRSSLEELQPEKVVEDSSRRKSNVRLNFDKVENRENGPVSSEVDVPSQNHCARNSQVEVEQPAPGDMFMEEEVSSSEESVERSLESTGDESENVGTTGPERPRRSRKKTTPSKYVAQKRRESTKLAEADQKTPAGGTPKKGRLLKKTPLKELMEKCEEKTEPAVEKQPDISNQADDDLVLREIDEILNEKPTSTSLDDSLDEKDKELVTETPEKQPDEESLMETPVKENPAFEKIAATPTIPFVQRIAGTPGILKKVDSPSTAEKKLRRVHFGAALDGDTTDTSAGDFDRSKPVDDLISSSPKGFLKKITPRRPFVHLQATVVEQVSKIAAAPSGNSAASPVKTEADTVVSADDEPIYPRLADCQESIGRIVGRLLPISSTTGAISARKALEVQGVVKICNLASMSRREVSLLNIKKPRIDTAIRALSQFAKDYFKPEPVSVAEQEELDVPLVQDQTEMVKESASSSAEYESTAEEVEIAAVLERKESAVSEEKEELRLAEPNIEFSDTPELPVESASAESEDKVETPPPTLTPTADEKKKILDAVREAYRDLENVAEHEGSGDYLRLRKAASKAARTLLDLVDWCEERS